MTRGKETLIKLFGIIFVLIAVLLVAIPLLVACDGDDETVEPTQPVTEPTVVPTESTAEPTVVPTEPTAEPTVPAAPAKPEGTLTVAMTQVASDPDLGPFTRGATSTRTVWTQAADYLVLEKHDESGFVPCLAEEWEIAPDDMSISFKLRQGVQFHDGWGELTSEDVMFTIESAIDPKVSKWTVATGNLGPLVDRIETAGPYELTIYLTAPIGEEALLYLCPTNQLALGIVSKAYYDEVGFEEGNKKPVFSGPYRLTRFQLGEGLEMEAVEDHWRVVPEFQKLIFKEVPELMTRAAMIQTGEADIAQVSPDHAIDLQSRGFDVVEIPDVETICLALMGQWVPTAETYDPDLSWLDKRVRQAINIAIDREEIAQQIFRGMAKPVPDFMYLPFGEEREPYPYDPELAKQLLEEAGYHKGFDAEMWIYVFAGRVDPTDTLLAVAGYLANVDIDMEITSCNIMAVYGDIIQRKTNGVAAPFLIEARNQPLYTKAWDTLIYSKGATFPMYESEECDRLVEEFMAVKSPDEQRIATGRIAQYLYDEYAFMPLLIIDSPWARGDRVANWSPAGINYLELEYATHAEPLGTFRLFEQP